MKNNHLEKTDRNQKIRELLIKGWTQGQVAREFNITIQRVNDLVQKWMWRGLLKKTKRGFAMPKSRTSISS